MAGDRVKAQIEKPLREEIIEWTQQDSALVAILGCELVYLIAGGRFHQSSRLDASG
jgi:hypothetical protein